MKRPRVKVWMDPAELRGRQFVVGNVIAVLEEVRTDQRGVRWFKLRTQQKTPFYVSEKAHFQLIV